MTSDLTDFTHPPPPRSRSQVAKEDFSDIMEEAERKRKRKQEGAAGGAKRSKKDGFKF